MGVLAGWDLHQSKAHPGLPNTSQYNTFQYKVLPSLSAVVWLQGQCQVMTPPQFEPLLGVRVDLGVENDDTNRNVARTFLFDFYIHYLWGPLLHRLAAIHNAEDRQPDSQTVQKMSPPTASGRISGERFKRRLRNWTHLSGTIGPTNLLDMTQ